MDLGIRLGLAAYLENRGFVDDIQVIVKFLDVFKTTNMIDGLDATPRRPDKHELHTKAILAADDLLFGLIVVGGGAQVAEDEFGDPDLVFGVFGDVDAVAVVDHGYDAVIGDANINVRNWNRAVFFICSHSDDVVAAIHNAFIEQLVEARIVVDMGFYNCVGLGIVDKLVGFHDFDRADVGVGVVEDVLFIGLFLIL